MKTVLVISDTHKNMKALENLFPIMEECDYIIHLGDFSSDMKEYKKMYGEKLIVIDGNCDFFSNGEIERIIKIEEVNILCCHGHKYGVKSGLEKLKKKGLESQVNICLFGHTHNAVIIKEEKIMLINPGCMTNMSSQKTYAYIVINDKKAFAKIIHIN
jgi:hypothetical protein